jgi:hypothetical protein
MVVKYSLDLESFRNKAHVYIVLYMPEIKKIFYFASL